MTAPEGKVVDTMKDKYGNKQSNAKSYCLNHTGLLLKAKYNHSFNIHNTNIHRVFSATMKLSIITAFKKL